MRDSTAYKTYLAFSTGAATPKKAKNFKKPASPSKQKDLVIVEEPAEKPVLDKPKRKKIGASEGTSTKPGVLDVPKDKSESDFESWGDSRDDESNDKASEEVSDDSDDNGNDDASDDEKTESNEDEIPDLNQKTTYEQEEDDGHVTLTAAHVTKKTEALQQSSYVSSDFGSQFLIMENVSLADNEIISMMNIKVRHEEPSS
ncbi:hypothetical protein Tco_0756270 [Tanacetum coccineum]